MTIVTFGGDGGDVFVRGEKTTAIEMTIVTFGGDVFGGEKTMAIEMTGAYRNYDRNDVFGRGEKNYSHERRKNYGHRNYDRIFDP